MNLDYTEHLQSIFNLKKRFIFESPNDSRLKMQISPIEGHILSWVCSSFNLKKVVEIGTLFGYSAMCIASSIAEDGKLFSIEKSIEHSNIAKKNYANNGLSGKICQITEDALIALDSLSALAPFDAIFIDACKRDYIKYLDWAEAHIRKNGLIIADNVFLYGATIGACNNNRISKKSLEIIREFCARISDNCRYNSIILPVRDGISISVKLNA